MIAGITDPTRETLDELNRILGEGQYAISYAQESAGLRAIVRTHDRPAREWSTQLPPNVSPEQASAVWAELAQRVARSEGKLVDDAAASVGGVNGGAEEDRAEIDEDAGTTVAEPTTIEGPLPHEPPEEPPPAAPPPATETAHSKGGWFGGR